MGRSTKLFFNYFKHVPDVHAQPPAPLASGASAVTAALRTASQDLVITSTPGMIISAAGTVLLLVLFVFQLKDYLAVGSETTLVVDELIDDTLRLNFNVTLNEVCTRHLEPWAPCARSGLLAAEGRGWYRATRTFTPGRTHAGAVRVSER